MAISLPREEKIRTLHPRGKRGVRISKQKYGQTCLALLSLGVGGQAILKALPSQGPLTPTQLVKTLSENPKARLEGSLPWYMEVVKLALEARKVIERISKTTPESYRLPPRGTKPGSTP